MKIVPILGSPGVSHVCHAAVLLAVQCSKLYLMQVHSLLCVDISGSLRPIFIYFYFFKESGSDFKFVFNSEYMPIGRPQIHIHIFVYNVLLFVRGNQTPDIILRLRQSTSGVTSTSSFIYLI